MTISKECSLMSDGFTRGPWSFGNTARYERMVLGDGGKGRYVCHVTVEQNGGGIIAQSMEAEREANARLICAAPDLLEVCQRILDRGYVSESIEEERGDHLALRSAIAKATSQSGAA